LLHRVIDSSSSHLIYFFFFLTAYHFIFYARSRADQAVEESTAGEPGPLAGVFPDLVYLHLPFPAKIQRHRADALVAPPSRIVSATFANGVLLEEA